MSFPPREASDLPQPEANGLRRLAGCERTTVPLDQRCNEGSRQRTCPTPEPQKSSPALPEGPFTVSLIWCPEVPKGTHYALLCRTADGGHVRQFSGVLPFDAPSLNLARIRRRGATLGAEDVVLVLPHGHALVMPDLP